MYILKVLQRSSESLLEFKIHPSVVIGKIECSVHLYSSPWIKLPFVLKTTHFNHRDREETADFLKLYNGLNQLEKQTNKKLSTVTLEAKGKHCYIYHNSRF